MDEETRILLNKILDTLNDIRQQLADLSSPQSCGACNCGHCGCEDSDWDDEDEYDEDYDGNADDNYEMLPEDVLDHANQHLTSLMWAVAKTINTHFNPEKDTCDGVFKDVYAGIWMSAKLSSTNSKQSPPTCFRAKPLGTLFFSITGNSLLTCGSVWKRR